MPKGCTLCLSSERTVTVCVVHTPTWSTNVMCEEHLSSLALLYTPTGNSMNKNEFVNQS